MDFNSLSASVKSVITPRQSISVPPVETVLIENDEAGICNTVARCSLDYLLNLQYSKNIYVFILISEYKYI